jgi:hypothetical protein
MRVAAVLFGLALFAGLVVLAVAGVSGASAVLITAGAVVAMIGLGNAVGGRHTPNRSPYRPESTGDTGPGDSGTGTAAEDAER